MLRPITRAAARRSVSDSYGLTEIAGLDTDGRVKTGLDIA